MPYYIYRIQESSMAMVKNLEYLEEHEQFKHAKNRARELRAEQKQGDDAIIKVMFADNKLDAEEKLMEKREKPILMEHEK